MNFDLITLEKQANQSAGNDPLTAIMSFLPLVLLVIVMYFIMIRPQRKQQKAEQQMRESLQVGDEIITIGGIHGRVVSLKEDTMVVESVIDHSKLTFSRSALQTIVTVHDTPSAK